MGTIFHRHLMLEIGITGKTLICHPANATTNKADEKEESYYYKEPGDESKKFTGHVLPEFCKQQGAGKNS
jgi:hypothetical protein